MLLRAKCDDLEQYSRCSCLRISGIPESPDNDAVKKVLDFAKRVASKVEPGELTDQTG